MRTSWEDGRTTDRRARRRRRALGAAALAALLATVSLLGPSVAWAQEPEFRALVFSKTTGFRHGEAITQGQVAINALAQEHGFAVDATEDSTQFTEQNLANYDVVVLLNADGANVLDDDQEVAFERWVQRGGGVVGIHASANMNRDWAWYEDMMGGALFLNHPSGALQFQTATVNVEETDHPATAGLPADWSREDEWYNFTAEPRGKAHVLATLDESTYEEQDGSPEADDHPIAWCSNYDGGRFFYTALGHHGHYYAEPLFRSHLLGAIQWAAGAAEGQCGEPREGIPSDSSFDKVTLDDSTENPMELAVAPDLSVFYVELGGKVKHWDPETRQVRVVGTIPVHRGNENGLLGITLDPDFETNRWMYLFYSAPTPEEQHISRFTVAADGTIDMASEKVLLRIPHQRIICCHSAGSMTFGPDGNLYISTGDDTQHAASNGYNPIDDRLHDEVVSDNPDAKHAFDARRTSGNTNDLRGKILRITPQPDGTYTIPSGNLFPPFSSDPEKTRPEIYTMGHRNPFRIAVDQETGWVYNGEVGPDASTENPERGPRGYDELNQIREAGNMGWPYCIANNKAYHDWEFPSGPSGGAFDCEGGPTNDSAWNTGLTQVPPAKSALLWWPYTPYPSGFEWPEIPAGPGRTAIAGPTYHFDADSASETKLPEYYDDAVFFADWSRDWLALARLDAEGQVADIEPFMANTEFRAPQEMEMGPDGSLYILEWGVDFNYAGENVNPDSGLYRIDFAKGKRTPVARSAADVTSGPAPLTVSFSSEGSYDPDGDDVTVRWDFGDGNTSTEANPTHTYTEVGTYTVQLSIEDATGKVGTSTLTINAGNTRPKVAIDVPADGGFFDFGDEIAYSISVTDPEEGAIDCERVTLLPGIFHDEGGNAHVHPGVEQTGCEGVVQTPSESGHEPSALITQVLTASYTDSGGQPGSDPLSGGVTHRLNPKTIQAEHFAGQQGIAVDDAGGARGGDRVEETTPGDWIYFEPMNFTNIDRLSARYSGNGGVVEVRLDAPDGPLVSTLDLAPTGGNNAYAEVVAPIEADAATHRVYFVFAQREGGPANNLVNLDELRFLGKGVAVNGAPEVIAAADPPEGYVPLTVSFTGSATDPEGTAITYAWDFTSDGTVDATTANATHTYAMPGSYESTLTVTDADGRSSVVTLDVDVWPLPPVGDCFGSNSDQFNGTAIDKTLWNDIHNDAEGAYRLEGGHLVLPAGDGDFLGTAEDSPPVIKRFDPDGPWTITTKVTFEPTAYHHQAGLVMFSGTDDVITVAHAYDEGRRIEMFKEVDNDTDQLASIELPADTPTTLYLRLTFNGVNQMHGYWSEDGVTWNPVAPTDPTDVTEAELGVFANNGGQEGAGSPEARFDWFALDTGEDPCPGAPTVEGFADPAAGAAPLRVRLSATGRDPEGGEVAYRWDFGDGGLAFERNARHTYREPGTYTATVTATDPDGNIGRDRVEIVVAGPVNEPPTVSATADVDSGPAPLRVRFRAEGQDPDGSNGALVYEWDFGDGARASGRNASHRYLEPGTYTARVTVTDAAGGTGTATVTVTVRAPLRR